MSPNGYERPVLVVTTERVTVVLFATVQPVRVSYYAVPERQRTRVTARSE